MKTNVCYQGDCLDVLPTLPDNSVDSIVTDPPYELGFMGKGWDNTGIAYSVPMWKECLRVLKPGGHLLSFSGTRTYHRMAVAIEDAGFEVRDMIEWCYGSGFPKSLNIAKMIDKRGGKSVSWFGKWLRDWRLKENIPQKEISKLFPSKTGGLTGCVANWELGLNMPTNEQFNLICKTFNLPFESLEEAEREIIGTTITNKTVYQNIGGTNISGEIEITKGTSEWEGWGTALKPAHEPICLARKPLAEKTVAENVLKYGTGGINIDESRVEFGDETDSRIGTDAKAGGSKESMYGGYSNVKEKDIQMYKGNGRFPANLIHDNSEEVRECFPETISKWGTQKNFNVEKDNTKFLGGMADKELALNSNNFTGDSGNASRFFKSILYYPKASKSERNKNTNNYLIIEICVENTEVAQLQPKVILEKTELWFTELFGKEKMEEYQMDFKSTIKTETKKTTILVTLNYSQHLNIKEYIVGVIKTKTENGGSPVASVANISEWRAIITDELMAYLLGVNPVVSPTQLRISVNANNFHSTVKPTALMSYLIKMITPKGGIVLDHFSGSGSTLVAARDNGFQYIGIEMTEEYLPIIKARTGCEIIKPEITIEEQDEIQEETTSMEEKLEKLGVINKNICPECGGKIKGKYCEDCFWENV